MPSDATTKKRAAALRVTERDLDVLDALASYRFLSVPQLAALFFATRGTAESRLRRLYQHGLVHRVFVPARPYDRRTCTVYALAAAGSRLLAPRHEGTRPPWLTPSQRRSALELDHTLRRNDLRICLELLSRRHPTLELRSWRQARADVEAVALVKDRPHSLRSVKIVPDGLVDLRHKGGHEAFAIEIDMATVPVKRMAERYRAYWFWWRRGGYLRRHGPVAFRVLTLTTNARHVAALRRAAVAAPPDDDRGSGLFWFATLDVADIGDPGKLLRPFWTSGRLDEPKPQRLFPSKHLRP